MPFATAAAIIGTAKGLFNWYTDNQKRKDQISEYEQQLDNLEIQKNNYLSELSMNHEDSITSLNNQIEATDMSIVNAQTNQQSSLYSGSKVASENSKLMNIEYASLLDSVKQSTGTAIASSATSGFRMSDSAKNLEKIAEKNGASAISKFKIQSDLENYQSYENIRQEYENYNNQIEGYQFEKSILHKKVESENENYITNKQNYMDLYDQKTTYIESEKETLEDGAWLTHIGGLLNTISGGAFSYASYK